MNHNDRMFVARELRKIARELLASSDYIYDPSHKNNPGGSYHPTPKGWGINKDSKKEEQKHSNKDSVGARPDAAYYAELKPTPFSKAIESYRGKAEKYFARIKEVSDVINQELLRNLRDQQEIYSVIKSGEDTVKTYIKLDHLFWEKKELDFKRKYVVFEGLELPQEQQGKIQVGKVNSEIPKQELFERHQIPFQLIKKIVSKDILPKSSLNISIEKEKKDDRASYNKDTLKMKELSGDGSWIHEIMHWIEDNNLEVKRKCIDFLNYRTQNDKIEKLSDLKKGYKKDEYTKKDKFFDPYCGKIYEKEGKLTGTEILSMGLPKLMKDPFEFYKNDPEYFGFIIGVLRGEI